MERGGGTQSGHQSSSRRLVKGQDDLMEIAEEAPPNECGGFPMRGSPTKMGEASRWDLRTVQAQSGDGSCLVCLNIYDPVHPLCTRIARCLHCMGLYEITPVHYPLPSLLPHPCYSTFRTPSLRLVPLGSLSSRPTALFLRSYQRSSCSSFLHLFFDIFSFFM